MSDQKVENLLNLAMDATNGEKMKSENLGTGFDSETDTWEIIVRYVGDILALKKYYPEIQIVLLLGQYAIVTIKQNQLLDFSNEEIITYIEKSKRLFFSVAQGRSASCINPVQASPWQLTGKGVLTAVIDSGIDYTHRDFRNADGTTRIEALWDQSINGVPPDGYDRGTLYTKAIINQALLAKAEEERKRIVPSTDSSGHGTAVAGIMAGNGNSSSGRYQGVAPGSQLLVVKMGRADRDDFPGTVQLMLGLDFVIRQAITLGKPVAINISFGNSYGAHDGSTLLESYINTVSQIWKNNIVIAAGNDGAASGHFSVQMRPRENLEVALNIGAFEQKLNLQIWKRYGDDIDIRLISPSGMISDGVPKIPGVHRWHLDDTDLLFYYGEPAPHSTYQEIYINFIPQYTYVTEGIWTIQLKADAIIYGQVEMWLPSSGVLNQNTFFLRSTPELSITIPGTAERAITVGAYNVWLEDYADFSGRGYVGAFERVKPELVAPGVNILTTASGGGYTTVSGTSFAAPFVTGSAALLMEYGIVQRNDPFLYGDKLKAYLIKGARPLRGIDIYPDIKVGFGALCLENSLP